MERAGNQARGDYRPELDGLRAIAILFVLFDHFDLLDYKGGFAGVDVFFVLSGFLITGQFARFGADLSWSRIGRFYERRFWRIAPAYVFVILATLAAGAWVLTPADLTRLSKWAQGAAYFAVNFNPDSGYFAPSAIYTPLLHLWSLGVEAQFYLLWPLLLRYALRGSPRRRFVVLGLVGCASLVVSCALSLFDPKAAFYALPSRLWEFSLGAAVALAPPFSGRARAATALALFALLAAPLAFDSYVVWPAPLALAITLPTAFLVYAARDPASPAYRLLACAPAAWIGRVSYSIYLVHWPLWTLATYRVFPTPSLALRLALFALSSPLGYALYRLVETPLRRVWRSPRRAGWALAGAATLAALYGSAAGLATPGGGTPSTLDEEALLGRPACAAGETPAGACLVGAPTAAPSAALWGDSHAGHLVGGFAEAFTARGERLAAFADPSCPPLPGLRVANNALNGRDKCRQRNDRVLAYLLATPSIRTVYLAGRWPAYAEAKRFGRESGPPYYLVDDSLRWPNVETSRAFLQASLSGAVAALRVAGKRVVLISSVPELGFDGGRCALAPDAAARCVVDRAAVEARDASADRVLATIPGVRRVDPRASLCDAKVCAAMHDGAASYEDFHHLTLAGARPIVAAALAAGEW